MWQKGGSKPRTKGETVTESNLHYGCTGVSTNVQSGYCAVNNGFVKNSVEIKGKFQLIKLQRI